MPSKSHSPNEVLSTTDRGDDTQRRYRYQAAYAALLSLSLLDEKSGFEEILCEQHEDILVKRKDGKFIGVQVKTRQSGQGPFRFNDREIMESLEGFIRNEKKFPDAFARYVICSNCGFWQQKKNYSNLVHCLKLIKMCDGSTSCLVETDFRERIEELSRASECNEDFILKTLNKVEIEEWFDLERYEMTLVAEVARLTRNETQRYDALKKVSEQLIAVALSASALRHSSPRDSYISMLENPEATRTDSIIQSKKITADMVKEIIDTCLGSPATLQTVASIDISDLPKGMNKMECKMAKGGLSPQNIELMKHLKFSADKLLIEWYHKHGEKEANARYQHVSLIVRNECQEAHDLACLKSKLFGKEMLTDVRTRIRKRYDEVKQKYHECVYEHLIGIAGILTEECKIWWSDEFDVGGAVL